MHKEKEMADFRRWIYALAVVALLAGFTVPVSAQATTHAWQHFAVVTPVANHGAALPAMMAVSDTSSINIQPVAKVAASMYSVPTESAAGVLSIARDARTSVLLGYVNDQRSFIALIDRQTIAARVQFLTRTRTTCTALSRSPGFGNTIAASIVGLPEGYLGRIRAMAPL